VFVSLVSLRGRRGAVAVDIAETAAALDSPGTGNVVFATLVDDPAAVVDRVDAYLGEIMLEAASANTVLDASVPATYAVDVLEAAAAVSAQDATAALPVTYVTWDPATANNVTLSGGNLVATNTVSYPDVGVRVATASGKTSSKYYFEIELTTVNAFGGGGYVSIGICLTTADYLNLGASAGTGGIILNINSGNLYAGGSNTGFHLTGADVGSKIGIAVDLVNYKAWFRVAPSGDWDGNGSHDPVTNVGGITVPAGTIVPVVTFGGSGGSTGNAFTANFGATAFTGAAPSGFTAGWPT